MTLPGRVGWRPRPPAALDPEPVVDPYRELRCMLLVIIGLTSRVDSDTVYIWPDQYGAVASCRYSAPRSHEAHDRSGVAMGRVRQGPGLSGALRHQCLRRVPHQKRRRPAEAGRLNRASLAPKIEGLLPIVPTIGTPWYFCYLSQ